MRREIKYINKDFNTFRNELLEFAKNYFPSTYNNFTEDDPGMMMIEMASFVGDVLAFYGDRNIQEIFSSTAINRDSLIDMAYALGYKPRVTGTAFTELSVSQLIPSFVSGSIVSPDYRYALIIDKEAKVRSTENDVIFFTQDRIDFSFSSSQDPTLLEIHSFDTVNNRPEYYRLTKKVKATAGEIKVASFTFGSPQRFETITLPDTNIIQILDVIDEDGNKWYEVPYLAQNTIFDDIRNTQENDPQFSPFKNEVPYLLKLRKVPRRFSCRYSSDNTLSLEFGSGISTVPDEEILPNSDNVGMGLPDSISRMNSFYDPSNFLYSREYGLVPANTTLTIRYVIGGGVNSNVPANTVNFISEIQSSLTSVDVNSLNRSLVEFIRNGISVTNELPASGGGDGDTIEDLRNNIAMTYGSQFRCVTPDDFVVRALSLPSKYGHISKVLPKKDLLFRGEKSLNYSLYVLSFDNEKKLKQAPLPLKYNLRNYISQFKMPNDGIDIKDAFVINIGVMFDIVVLSGYNSRDVLAECINLLVDYFDIDKWQISQPIILSEIYNIIYSVKGVNSVNRVEIVNKTGELDGYSRFGYDIKAATKNGVIYPSMDPSIFEVKFPEQDIKGRIIKI